MRKIFLLLYGFLQKKHIYIIKSLSFHYSDNVLPPNLDFVRYKTLELCANEVLEKNLDGDIAEVGVYKGNFSQKLNLLFPNKMLYLFDTFEGFDSKDVAIEQTRSYSTGTQDFSDTSIEGVLSKMRYKERCIVKQGFFPQTANGIINLFCFVSLDADLYQPIYEGLHFFYPKLVAGGYIFIHDFNNDEYKGAREAVIRFCQENKINYTPIPDNGGTAIITK